MNPVLIYLMRIEGISVNIDSKPNEKQWAKILEWTEELKAAQAAKPEPIQAANVHPLPKLGNGAADTTIMAQVEELKRTGQAKANVAPVAMDAGPAGGMVKKK
jgi:hypothetical protein